MIKEFTVRFEVEGNLRVIIPNTITDSKEKRDYAIDIFEDEDFGPLEEVECDMITITGNHASLVVTGWCNVVVTLDENCSKEEIEIGAQEVFDEEDFGPLEDIDCAPIRYFSDEGEYNF